MQTLDAIESQLPNGLHDAQLRELRVDYASRRAILVLNVLTSTPESEGQPEYRQGELRIDGLFFLVLDPPGPGATLDSSRPLRIDGGPGQPSTATVKLPDIPPGYFLHWFFVDEWNAFIRVAARSAAFEWLNDA
jgi:hypothetical protein